MLGGAKRLFCVILVHVDLLFTRLANAHAELHAQWLPE